LNVTYFITALSSSNVVHRCQLGLEWYWHWVIGYWAIFADIG